MGRLHRVPRERVRVELRLAPQIAEMLYDSAREWDVSLSEAGTRLILAGRRSNQHDSERAT